MRKQKEVIITLCEGEAEVTIFNFLKINFLNKRIVFKGPENLGGIRDLAEFKRKYYQKIRKYSLKPATDFKNVRFLFIIDNDLDDSAGIERFIKQNGNLVQLCDPNTEGMILSIIGKGQVRTMASDIFRRKCKLKFKKHFQYEAHKLKDSELKKIFSDVSIIEDNLPILYTLFIE
jgi:hypothetical protein